MIVSSLKVERARQFMQTFQASSECHLTFLVSVCVWNVVTRSNEMIMCTVLSGYNGTISNSQSHAVEAKKLSLVSQTQNDWYWCSYLTCFRSVISSQNETENWSVSWQNFLFRLCGKIWADRKNLLLTTRKSPTQNHLYTCGTITKLTSLTSLLSSYQQAQTNLWTEVR